MSLTTIDKIIELEKSQEPPVDQSSFFIVIRGHEALSVQIQSGGLPMPRRGNMEYSTMVGVKSGASGKIQNWQTALPTSWLEREDGSTHHAIIRLLADNYADRNNLVVEYWIGNGRDVKSVLWGTISHAFLANEDGSEFDTESEDTPLKLSGTTLNGWLHLDCPNKNPTTVANAIATLDILKANQGLEHC